jgi:serine/threonine-protein kinase
MATVYLAEDVKHHRKVAVKVLRPELAAVLGPERFLREIDIAAKLNHPHILPLHDSGEANGFLYYVMPVVEGNSLRERLNHEKQLSIDDTFHIADQVASALDYAHRHHVIHRDIKPENILLHEGEAMVADFGIALAVSAAGGERLTETGLSLGTPEYMSPEQATGDRQLDARSDVYSLATVVYEMLVGEPPFTGPTAQAVIARHVTDSVPPVTTVRPNVGKSAARAVAKALNKAPADRFDTATSFSNALRAPAPKDEGITSIAVLPLTNLSGDPTQEYFSDGMTEALITDLAKIGALKVISRTSVMRYKGSDKPLPEIARELGVDAIVEGSVLRAGDEVRITAQLIHAASDTHIWAESYDRDLTNILSLQAEVARAVAREVEVKLTPHEETRLVVKQTVNPAAHEAYLKGRYFWNQRGPGLKKSVELFERALAHDDHYAPGYAGLADAYAMLGFYAYAPPREVMPKAKAAALKALEIDEHLVEAHASLGYIYTIFEWEWEKGRRELQRALELNPSYGPARVWYCVWLWFMGRIEEANAEVRHGLERDPLSVVIHLHLGIGLVMVHKYAEASQQLLQGLELDPDFAPARAVLGMVYYFQSRVEDGIYEIHRAIEASDRDPWPLGIMGAVYAATGDRKRAEQILAELEERTQSEYIPATHIAAIYALIGEKDTALEWLEKAYEERAPLVLGSDWLHAYPGWAFESLRADSRFQDLMRRMGLRAGG